jgi:hypothetical protein
MAVEWQGRGSLKQVQPAPLVLESSLKMGLFQGQNETHGKLNCKHVDSRKNRI